MAKRSILGLFQETDAAADGVEAVQAAGFAPSEYEVLTGLPYPEGAFGEPHVRHRLYVFPLVGAACGLAVALLLTAGTQLGYPVVTGGKPILSLPPMAVVSYEGTMLGAILFTVLGIIFESRLPRVTGGVYDPRITEGWIGVGVTCDEERLGRAEEALRQAGSQEIRREPSGDG